MNKLKNRFVSGIGFADNANELPCKTCLKGKHCRQPFKNKGTRATEILGLIHSDLCRPMEEKSFSGAKYFLTIIDDFSRKVFVYFRTSKAEVIDVFDDFRTMVENQTGKKIKAIRTELLLI